MISPVKKYAQLDTLSPSLQLTWNWWHCDQRCAVLRLVIHCQIYPGRPWTVREPMTKNQLPLGISAIMSGDGSQLLSVDSNSGRIIHQDFWDSDFRTKDQGSTDQSKTKFDRTVQRFLLKSSKRSYHQQIIILFWIWLALNLWLKEWILQISHLLQLLIVSNGKTLFAYRSGFFGHFVCLFE